MDDLKYIKKYYGEKMMHLCRDLFSTILETPGVLFKIIDSSFAHSKNLYYDIIENKLEEKFYDYIYQRSQNSETELKITTISPQELMSKVGYKLYECNTEEDIQSFKKYYKQEEKLCTFNGGRLNSCYVFFAVREDAQQLKREDFKKPRREDDYGISVISIQISKGNNTLSIKNRYNHTVVNPDATYGNNLENIIPGLTTSFEKKYGFKINQNNREEFDLPNYTEVKGKLYKYNYEINNIYYCPNNMIIENGKITQYPQEQYIIMDYFILNLKDKTLTLLDENIVDGFIDEYKNIERIEIKKEDKKKKILITTKENIQSIITINNENQIIEYVNNNIEETKPYFMDKNKTIENIDLPNLQIMGKKSFNQLEMLKTLNVPNLEKMEDECFYWTNKIEKLNLPSLKIMKERCFIINNSLKELNAPNLEKIEKYCFHENKLLERVNLPKLQIIDPYCFYNCNSLEKLDLPNLKKMECYGLYYCSKLEELNLPNLQEMGEFCFKSSSSLKKLDLPNLKKMECTCFYDCRKLEELNLPNLQEMGYNCFCNSYLLEKINASNLQYMDSNCFYHSIIIKSINLTNLHTMDDTCFYNSNRLKEVHLPNLRKMGEFCFYKSYLLEMIEVPETIDCRSWNITSKLNNLQKKYK